MRIGRHGISLLIGATALALAGVVSVAATAGAHSTMIAASPVPGSIVEEFDEVVLEFDGALAADAEHLLSLETGEGEPLQTLPAEMVSDTKIRARFTEPDPGVYLVSYDVVSADEGFGQNGNYLFTLQPAASDSGAALFVAGGVGVFLAIAGLVAFSPQVKKRRPRAGPEDPLPGRGT